MCDSIEEVYQSMDEYIKEQEVNDYVQRGIYPERLITNHVKNPKYIPNELNDNSIPELVMIENISANNGLLDTHQILIQKVNQLEKTLKETMNRETNENDCPICMEDMGNHFVSPECGHKLCIKCFATTIRLNSNQCCLCRRKMV